MHLTVRPCRGRRDWILFERVPELLHGGRAPFIPPFPGSVSGLRKPDHPFHRHGEMFPFLAFHDEEVVGRVAGIVNRTHNRFHGDTIRFVGFYEAIDDDEVASALFEAAEGSVAHPGCDVLRGPFSPTQNDACGVLVDGFEHPPSLMMPWNPPYYERHFEANGWAPARDLYAYAFTPDASTMERSARIAERTRKKSDIVIRRGERKHFLRELRIVHRLFNETLADEWNFMPLAAEDLEYAARDLGRILDPGLVLFAEHEGRPVGFCFSVPNANELMERAKGTRGLRRLWTLARHARRPFRSFRLAMLGVLPEYRNKGISPSFFAETFRHMKKHYDFAEVSWVQDINEQIHKAAAFVGSRRYKTYRVYEKRRGSRPGGAGGHAAGTAGNELGAAGDAAGAGGRVAGAGDPLADAPAGG